MKKKAQAQVHRFHDKVATYIGDGSTHYLTAAEARKLAKLFNACARDIDARKFADSQFTTTVITVDSPL